MNLKWVSLCLFAMKVKRYQSNWHIFRKIILLIFLGFLLSKPTLNIPFTGTETQIRHFGSKYTTAESAFRCKSKLSCIDKDEANESFASNANVCHSNAKFFLTRKLSEMICINLEFISVIV